MHWIYLEEDVNENNILQTLIYFIVYYSIHSDFIMMN